MIVSQQQKTINIALAKRYEKALRYNAMALQPQMTRRDKLTWLALAVEAVRDYNDLLLTLSPLGSSNLAKEAKLEMTMDLKVKLLHIEEFEIQEMTDLIFGTTLHERRQHTNKNLQAAIDYFNNNPGKVQALANSLHRVGMNLNGPPKIGDAQKGGIVRHLVHDKGLPIDEARQQAEEQIVALQAAQKIRDGSGISGLTKQEINKVLVDAGEAPIIPKVADYSNRDMLLDLLTPAPFTEVDRPDLKRDASETCPTEPDFSEFDTNDSDAVNNSNPPASASNTGADTTAQVNTATLDSTSTAGNTTPKVIPVKISPPTPSSPQKLSQVKLGQLQAVSEAIVNSGLLDALERRKEK